MTVIFKLNRVFFTYHLADARCESWGLGLALGISFRSFSLGVSVRG